MFDRVPGIFSYRVIICCQAEIHKNIKEPRRNFNPKIRTRLKKGGGGHFVYISTEKSEFCPIRYLEVHLLKTKLDISNGNENPYK